MLPYRASTHRADDNLCKYSLLRSVRPLGNQAADKRWTIPLPRPRLFPALTPSGVQHAPFHSLEPCSHPPPCQHHLVDWWWCLCRYYFAPEPTLTGCNTAQLCAFADIGPLFKVLTHVIPTALITGWLLIIHEGGFANAPWTTNLMQLLGIIMAVLFVMMYWGLTRKHGAPSARSLLCSTPSAPACCLLLRWACWQCFLPALAILLPKKHSNILPKT